MIARHDPVAKNNSMRSFAIHAMKSQQISYTLSNVSAIMMSFLSSSKWDYEVTNARTPCLFFNYDVIFMMTSVTVLF